jgi:glycosyltransferase involved in cell wall biosynthesis
MMTAQTQSIRLSAVVPNYNHSAVIGDAISALAKQMTKDDEIIVVDDGSTDNSIAILEHLSREYPIMRVVSLDKNQGAIFALNRGLQEARGKYVNFAAADDLIRPGLFASLFDILERYPQAAYASSECIVYDTDTGESSFRPPVRPRYVSTFLTPTDVADALRRIDNWILTGSAVVRRDYMLEAGGFDGTLGSFADGYVFRRLALQYGCCYVPKPGVVWRVSKSGYSRSQAADPAATMSTLTTALERIRADPIFPAWYPKTLERRWRFGIGRIAAASKPMNRALLAVLGRGRAGKAVLAAAAALGGSIGRTIAIIWLSLQERPTSFRGLVRTWLSRRYSQEI